MPLLSVQQLSKQFNGRKVVKDSSLTLSSGEVIGLLGPNGAGKTTTFYMIVGLIAADTGKIFLDNLNITRYPIHQRAQLGIGYLPQEPSIFRQLSVADNILAILQTRRDINKRVQHHILEQLLDDFNLTAIRDSIGISLSGGERRRVEIARALATEPKFILLDEPFAGVDPISVIDIQTIIQSLAERGIGILITDHNVRETLSVCNRAYIFNAGEVIAQGEPAVILADKTVKEVYLGNQFTL